MTTATHSRRTALGALATIAAGAFAAGPVTDAIAEPADPIFAAIEAHRAAWATFEATVIATDDVKAKQEGRILTEADEAAYERDNGLEQDALYELVNTVPLTMAGVRAAIAYLVELDEGCVPEDSGAFLSTLLRSPVFANV